LVGLLQFLKGVLGLPYVVGREGGGEPKQGQFLVFSLFPPLGRAVFFFFSKKQSFIGRVQIPGKPPPLWWDLTCLGTQERFWRWFFPPHPILCLCFPSWPGQPKPKQTVFSGGGAVPPVSTRLKFKYHGFGFPAHRLPGGCRKKKPPPPTPLFPFLKTNFFPGPPGGWL